MKWVLKLMQNSFHAGWIYQKQSYTDSRSVKWLAKHGLWVLTFSHRLWYSSYVVRQWKGLQIEYCIFNKRLPKIISRCNAIWTQLCRVTTWFIWIERKDWTFNNYTWEYSKLARCIWDRLLDYGKLEWYRTLRDWEHTVWELWQTRCPHHTVYARDKRNIRWSYNMPKKCGFLW